MRNKVFKHKLVYSMFQEILMNRLEYICCYLYKGKYHLENKPKTYEIQNLTLIC